MAEIVFDYSPERSSVQERHGLSAIIKGTGQLSMQHAETTKVVLHLGQAIDAQSKGHDTQAADELDHALEAGFNHPALYFDLGLIRSKGDRLETALRHLQHSVKHNDFGLAARLLLGQINQKMGRLAAASVEYLEALKIADSQVVPAEQSDEIRQMYEPLIEAQANETSEVALKRLCDKSSLVRCIF